MSEIDYLIKQLEYSFKMKNEEKAVKIVNMLKRMKAKIQIDFEMAYTCSSHYFLMNSKAQFKDLKKLKHFKSRDHYQSCDHYVCFDCLEKYIRDNFNTKGVQFEYICPGCSAANNKKPTKLAIEEKYFTDVVSVEEFKKKQEENEMISQATLRNLAKTDCYFQKYRQNYERCLNNKPGKKLPRCDHHACIDCAINYFHHWGENDENIIKCFAEDCEEIIDHEYIEELMSFADLDDSFLTKIFLKLKLEKNNYYACKNCQTLNKLVISEIFKECRKCGLVLCCSCGNKSHSNVLCYIIKKNINEYTELDCINTDDEELKMRFNHAVSLFEWNLHKKTAIGIINEVGFKLRVIGVKYIYNPVLIAKFEEAKEKMIQEGTYENELFVFHATYTEYISKICQEGFKVGGIDVDQTIGKVHGYGVYTAYDATLSISYFTKVWKNTKKKYIFVCKAVKGLRSSNPIHDAKEFLNTKFNFYEIEQSDRSTICVFLQREIVIPYYLVEFE